MLGMGHDDAIGKMVKENGRWQISWPGHKDGEYRQMVFQEFERLAQAHGGRYKRLKAFGALGVNPYMTIGALAIRTAEHILANPNHSDLFG